VYLNFYIFPKYKNGIKKPLQTAEASN